jgi:hypothetical protein
MRFGDFLVSEGRVTRDSVRLALAQQRRRRVPLGVLAVRAGMIDVAGVERVLGTQAGPDPWRLFGGVARDLGLLDAIQIDLLLSRQKECQPRIGDLLVEQGALTEGELPTLLAHHRRPRYRPPPA